jgi:hypothetical protein
VDGGLVKLSLVKIVTYASMWGGSKNGTVSVVFAGDHDCVDAGSGRPGDPAGSISTSIC